MKEHYINNCNSITDVLYNLRQSLSKFDSATDIKDIITTYSNEYETDLVSGELLINLRDKIAYEYNDQIRSFEAGISNDETYASRQKIILVCRAGISVATHLLDQTFKLTHYITSLNEHIRIKNLRSDLNDLRKEIRNLINSVVYDRVDGEQVSAAVICKRFLHNVNDLSGVADLFTDSGIADIFENNNAIIKNLFTTTFGVDWVMTGLDCDKGAEISFCVDFIEQLNAFYEELKNHSKNKYSNTEQQLLEVDESVRRASDCWNTLFDIIYDTIGEVRMRIVDLKGSDKSSWFKKVWNYFKSLFAKKAK